ncbi:MAG: hypothetical protein RL693_290 [Verrucomicrobiota bacterium]
MKSFCIALIVVCFVSVFQQSSFAQADSKTAVLSLDEMVSGEQLWETTAEQFEQQHSKLNIQWLSQSKDQARFFGRYVLWNNDLQVPETIAEFQGGKLARLNLSLFNRGDSASKMHNKEEFEKEIERIKGVITAKLGVQPVERGKDSQSAVKAVGLMWMKAPTAYLLESSYQKEVKSRGEEFRPEFIRLRVAQIPKQQGLLAANTTSGNQPVSKTSLSANISRESNGDVVIKNVPMVDQGPKGYCAVATTERIFRYYGMAVDQHEMAQVANTGEGGGTSPTEMIAALEKLEARLRIRVRALDKWDYKEFTNMVSDYNREAKSHDKKEIDLAGMRVIDIGAIYASMDPESLKTSRTVKNKSGYSKFQRMVVDTIEKGVPLMWGVQLGLFKEEGLPQSFGGHMRLIIGYNTQTSEILYSDSWGSEHALKRMPMDNACSMTTGLYYLEPMK